MAWTNIANANLDVGAAIRSVDILALRDNITALANGDTGAPRIKPAALGSGQTGNAPIFAARAWVSFNGANPFTPNPSTSAIYASGNVSSVARNTTGAFTINFATAMPDSNYAIAGSAGRESDSSGSEVILFVPLKSLITTSSVKIRTSSGAGTAFNSDTNVIIMR